MSLSFRATDVTAFIAISHTYKQARWNRLDVTKIDVFFARKPVASGGAGVSIVVCVPKGMDMVPRGVYYHIADYVIL